MMEGQKGLENIGLLIPEHGALVLKKRIAVKHFGPKMPVFSVQERANTMVETVAVQPDCPFDHLQKLHRAYLVWSGEEPRLAFRKIP